MKVKKGEKNCIFYFSTRPNIISVFSSISIESFIAKNTSDVIEINFLIYDILGNMECVLRCVFLCISSNGP